MKRITLAALALSFAYTAHAETPRRIGHKNTVWRAKGFAKHRAAAMKLGGDYRRFITLNRTEREVVTTVMRMAKKRGYRDLLSGKLRNLKPGAKVHAVVHGKLAALVVVGTKPLAQGVHVVASHIDAVRIDLKQNAVYADGNLAMFETHYYGGIKKYQWLSTPLALHGVVVKKGGKRVNIAIGSNPKDPVFVIPDIAAHKSRKVNKTEGEQLPGEKLDPVIASTPGRATKKYTDRFAAAAAALLKRKYKIDASDLVSAELELIPATLPRDVGLDRAIVGGYGQDDRACSYAALRAIFDTPRPKHTAIVVLADKEEIGSTGNTGARSNFIRRVVAELIEATGGTSTQVIVDRVLSKSIVFSADVTGGVNPHYKKLYDKRNSAFMGSGVVWDQSAVHAGLMAYVRGLFNRNGITHQAANWGKSTGSKGERGTVLPFFTQHGMSGLNVAIPLLSMHAPFELVSKADLYEGFRAYRAFLRD